MLLSCIKEQTPLPLQPIINPCPTVTSCIIADNSIATNADLLREIDVLTLAFNLCSNQIEAVKQCQQNINNQ